MDKEQLIKWVGIACRNYIGYRAENKAEAREQIVAASSDVIWDAHEAEVAAARREAGAAILPCTHHASNAVMGDGIVWEGPAKVGKYCNIELVSAVSGETYGLFQPWPRGELEHTAIGQVVIVTVTKVTKSVTCGGGVMPEGPSWRCICGALSCDDMRVCWHCGEEREYGLTASEARAVARKLNRLEIENKGLSAMLAAATLSVARPHQKQRCGHEQRFMVGADEDWCLFCEAQRLRALADRLMRENAQLKAENERLRASAYTPIVVLQNGAVVSISEQAPDSVVVKVDDGWVLMALPHEETYIEIQVERE